MPGIKIKTPLVKNLLTIISMCCAVGLVVTAIYLSQVFYYHQQRPAPQPPATALHKITGIGYNDVFDLSGSEASGYGNPMNLFDENADPANGLVSHPHTSPLPNSKMGIFYPPGKGLRIVADLHDNYGLSDFYIYDQSLASDSVWLYTGAMNNWTLVAAYASAGNPAAWGWQHFRLAQDARYVMIRFNSAKPVISEWVMYGNLRQKLPADSVPRLPALPAPTLRQFAGTNAYDYVQPALLQPFQQTRLYQMMDYYDVDTVNAYPNNKISLNALHLPQLQQPRYYADSLRHYGNQLWMSIRGQSKELQRQGLTEKDKPVTRPGMDTEDPLSYGRHAKTFWNMAALFGSTKCDTNLIDVNDMPRFSGLGLMDRFENGNEEDGYWTPYYWTPADYFAVSSADYDGHEGRLGPKHGLHQADRNSRLMTSGMIQLDTNRVKTLNFLCSQLRSDKKFIWEGGVQYHYYSNAATSNLQSPLRGISPEEDHLRQKLAKVRAFHNRLLPGIPLILGENGYDRNQQSWQRTPILPGYNEAQSQGIMVIRSLVAAFMAGFDGYNQYMMRNATNDENAAGPYASSGMIGGPANTVIYPIWYYWSAVVNQLGAYQPDAIVSETGPVWIYRLKSKADPAKKAFVLFCPTTNGSIVKKFILNTQNNNNQIYTEIKLSDKSSSGIAKTGQIKNNFIQADVGESPIIILIGK
jgi:hypothetical protein